MTQSLRELFVRQYRLCGLRADEIVAVVAETGRKQEYVDAAVAAAEDFGASALVLEATSLSAPQLPPNTEGGGKEIAALLAGAGECDLVIDVTVGGLIHSDVRTRITGAGKRMLFVAEPADVLGRLMGDEELRGVVEAAGKVLVEGSTFSVTSAAGTDVSFDISGELPITHQWGYVDEPGRWDHWPSGFIACFPKDRSGEGTIVLQPGDALIPFNRYVRDEVVITVEKGFMTDISGPGADAFLLRDYFAAWNDPDAFAISHVGWGVHPAARWSAFDVYDGRRLYGQELRSTAGSFMWSTGSNRFAGRETPAHLDIPMRGCTVAVDGNAVVIEGRLI